MMAVLHLADGTTFQGESFGAKVDCDGEVVFNTGMAGYPESLTDPSYRGQILVFTYPLIGNYGVPSEERNIWGFSKNFESEHIHVRGVIVAQASEHYSHHKAVSSLGNWLEHHKIPGITGVDTRALTKKLREHGVMLGRIRQEPEDAEESEEHYKLKTNNYKLIIEDPNLCNLVAEVSCKEVITYDPWIEEPPPRKGKGTTSKPPNLQTSKPPNLPTSKPLTIAAFDCGMKNNILRSLLSRGVRVHRLPWNFDLAGSDLDFDAVFVSNGPGDPKLCDATIRQMQWAMNEGKVTFGICLGNQLMALAAGGDTYKLKYGHRGCNQPCLEQGTERCIITSQNHGFAVDEKLPKAWKVWFRNGNDGTIEGIRHESGKFFAVQFHPEAMPGPEDANYLFDEFLEKVAAKAER